MTTTEQVLTIKIEPDHEGLHAKVTDADGTVIARVYDHVRSHGGSWAATRDAVIAAVKERAREVLGYGEPPEPESVPWAPHVDDSPVVSVRVRDPRVFVNHNGTVLVRLWANGLCEAAQRETAEHVWGAPIELVEEGQSRG